VSGSRNQNSPRNALAKGETSRSPSPSSVPAVPTGETQAPSGKRKLSISRDLSPRRGRIMPNPRLPSGQTNRHDTTIVADRGPEHCRTLCRLV
jgi:hypothetical protein